MKTDKDMREAIIRVLDEGTPDGHEAYDVEAILAACHKAANGWDLEQVDAVEFWQIVERIDTRDRERCTRTITARELLNAMIANFVAQNPRRPRSEEHAGRFETLFHAVTVIHADWTPEQAEIWLIEHIDELHLAAIQD